MPLCETGTVVPVGRELRIHELTSEDQATWDDPIGTVRAVQTPLIATVWSDAQGFFQAALPVGRYSIFTVEDSVLYVFGEDGLGNLSPFEVRENTVAEVHVDIRYQAAF
ncbi:MAG: hypothetical protein H6975_04770 [Gammaproteobacteria bacterium]|nr:hypothetical protein [Gammaproteobacteria bacterium]